MTKSELMQIISEVVKKCIKKAKKEKSADSYITSPHGEFPTLYINIKVETDNLESAEKLRENILKNLEKEHEIKFPKKP